nr:helix-turn-helix transcriptional regulator [Oceanococcus sp. HetDA_MAG_MS8]
MIRFRLSEQIADKQYRDGEVLSVKRIADETGLHRMTLSRLMNQKGYSTSTEVLDKLCNYFECGISDLVEHIPENKSTDE